ncbi:MAG TPA: hypothetical protein VMU57_21420 [Edaphobacter sp.]|uniref:hypothetical protein n=1 Tax=Edaphobacter sp. TaxID=1934404 RepID=UPI002C633EC6|nr:hypothetical protein [Edaphobacter sp.]HUZ97473.1 hypothetical protein [Edaphobacter sp.]
MTTWSVSLEAALVRPVDAFADVVDELLSILESRPEVLDPVTFLNVREHTFGARLTVQAEDMPSAVGRAIEVFLPSAESLGLSFMLRGGNILTEDALFVDEPAHSLASV